MHRLIFLTGTETTATLLSGATYLLLKHPDKMEKLTREIRAAFSDDADMTLEKLASVEYLHACLEEGLRMYPPVPVGLPRVVPAGGRVVCGQAVPADTSVYLSHYAAYHSENNFALPDEFHPERFLHSEDPRFANDRMDAFNPFSNGPRNCLGKK